MNVTRTFDPSLYVVVPREFTKDWFAAMVQKELGRELLNMDRSTFASYVKRWSEYLAAAPPLPEQPQGDKNLDGMLAVAETSGYWAGRQAVRDEVMAVLQAPSTKQPQDCIDPRCACRNPVPAGAAAPATAQAAKVNLAMERKTSSSIRASVPDEPQPAVRESAKVPK